MDGYQSSPLTLYVRHQKPWPADGESTTLLLLLMCATVRLSGIEDLFSLISNTSKLAIFSQKPSYFMKMV